MAGMLDPFEGIPPNCNRILLLGKEVSRIAPGQKPPIKAEKNMWCSHYQPKEKIEFEKLWTSTLLSVDERDVFLPTSETRRVNFNLWCFGRPFCAHVIILHPPPKTQSKGTSTKHQQGHDINMTWTSRVFVPWFCVVLCHVDWHFHQFFHMLMLHTAGRHDLWHVDHLPVENIARKGRS